MELNIPANGWRPRNYQLELWNYLANGGKRAAVLAHRRWGKDEMSMQWACVSALEKPATYWHMLPEAAQARKAIWTAINPHTGIRRIDEIFPKEIRKRTLENEMQIEFVNGAVWQVVGSDNFNSLIGSPPYGIVFSEYSVGNPASWAYLRPILAENGGWALFIYTARGKNHGYKLYNMASKSPDWLCVKSTVDQTNVFSQETLDQELKEMQSEHGEEAGKAYFLQEYHCSFDAAIPGAYYIEALSKAEQEGRITRVMYDPTKPVYTWWDLGRSDYTSIWFTQHFGNEVRVIDFYQNNNCGLEIYSKMLKDKGYTYEEHNLPHDAEYKKLSIGDKSIRGQLEELLPTHRFRVSVQTKSVNADINRTRAFIARCIFDADKTEHGLECLKAYSKKYNQAKQAYEDEPYHNWASHAADAFRELAVGYSDQYNITAVQTDNNLPTIAQLIKGNRNNLLRRRL